ncbi:MAG: cytochrome P450 [Flavisolibacter sp.]
MKPVLFLQSEVKHPFQIYKEMQLTQPFYRDYTHNICGVYSYNACKAILNNQNAIIPPLEHTGLNQYALTIAGNLVRLKNPPDHQIVKRVAITLFQKMQWASVSDTLHNLLENHKNHTELNWVDTVCKVLPVMIILNGFGFSREDCEFISQRMDKLVKIMLPVKNNVHLEDINNVSRDIYTLIERQIHQSFLFKGLLPELMADTNYPKEEILYLCISNLTGLLIQSYDACRGLLTNSLIQFISFENRQMLTASKKHFESFIIETLRYDPPVHNTRRLATADIDLENIQVKKGENILVILAAANRDEREFVNASFFDINRPNNINHLTFGLGPHKCLASQFAIDMATDALFYMAHAYRNIHIVSPDITYEPIINSRLATSLIISLTH